jgi:hypothetical protein
LDFFTKIELLPLSQTRTFSKTFGTKNA